MKPVPTPGNPWRRCLQCASPFAPTTEQHVYCCGTCRQQAWRTRHRKLYRCPGCGDELHVGHLDRNGRKITSKSRHCSHACTQRVYRWRKDGRLMRCCNEECPRHGVQTIHKYDLDADMWECHGCGQLQPARW
jgi:hypothetical protein